MFERLLPSWTLLCSVHLALVAGSILTSLISRYVTKYHTYDATAGLTPCLLDMNADGINAVVAVLHYITVIFSSIVIVLLPGSWLVLSRSCMRIGIFCISLQAVSILISDTFRLVLRLISLYHVYSEITRRVDCCSNTVGDLGTWTVPSTESNTILALLMDFVMSILFLMMTKLFRRSGDSERHRTGLKRVSQMTNKCL